MNHIIEVRPDSDLNRQIQRYFALHIVNLFEERDRHNSGPLTEGGNDCVAISERSMKTIPPFIRLVVSELTNQIGIPMGMIHPDTVDSASLQHDLNEYFREMVSRAGSPQRIFCSYEDIQYLGLGFLAIPILVEFEEGLAFVTLMFWESKDRSKWQITGFV